MPLAIFDLDDTLIQGDCATLWSEHMARLGWVDGATFVARDHALMARYARGNLAMEEYMAFALEPLVDRDVHDVAASVSGFIDEVIEPRFYTLARETVDAHRKRGDRLLVISASGEHLVHPIAERLGIHEVLAIELATEEGRYTGDTRGTLTYREGKVTRLQAWSVATGTSLAGASFYSDSRNDLPLLGLVDHPRAVNPDPMLRAHAMAHGWPILDWH